MGVRHRVTKRSSVTSRSSRMSRQQADMDGDRTRRLKGQAPVFNSRYVDFRHATLQSLLDGLGQLVGCGESQLGRFRHELQ